MGGKPAREPETGKDEVLQELTQLLVSRGAIEFGRFKGRGKTILPYQVHTDRLCSGQDAFAVGRALAITLKARVGEEIDCLVGSEYRSIPCTVLASLYYSLLMGRDTDWVTYGVFGEHTGGVLAEDKRVVVIRDVLTDGIDVKDTISQVKKTGANVTAVVTLVDHCERIKNRLVASDITRDTGVPVIPCATIYELIKQLDPASLPEPQQKIYWKIRKNMG